MLDRFVVPGARRAAQPWRWLPFGLRLRIAGLRALLGRRRLLRKALVVAVLAVFAAMVISSASAVRAEQAKWGTLVEVAVVIEGREVGDTVNAGHVRFQSLPALAVPDDAIGMTDALDVPAAISLHDGDVLRRRDLLIADNSVSDGQRAIAIPVGVDVPALSVGHRVDVFVFDDAFGPVTSSAAEMVTGSVVQLLEDAVVVSVDQQHARTVAAGVVNGRVLLAAA